MAKYTVGLDLGQKRDFSAAVVAEGVQIWHPGPRDHLETFEQKTGHEEDAYHVRHVQRWKIGTPYTVVVEDVVELLRTPELCEDTMLVFDRTGVGGAVADLIFQSWMRGDLLSTFPPLGITFTAGFSQHGGGQGFNDSTAHKGDVIARMAMLLNTGRLLLPPGLPAGDLLEKELRSYQIKQNQKTGHTYTEAAKERDHDDLVTALALSVWLGPIWGRPRYLDPHTGILREWPDHA